MTNKIYISGPITGMPDRNAPLFNEVSRVLSDAGIPNVNPIALDDDQEPESWDAAMRRDIMCMVSECDSVMMLPGWEESDGARVEYHLAIGLKWQVYNWTDAIAMLLTKASFEVPESTT